jgi:hypothetical protein
MLSYFDKESMPPEIRMIYEEMVKIVAENEKLRARVATVEARCEVLRTTLNKIARESKTSQSYEIPKFTDIFQVETKHTPNGTKTTMKSKGKGFFSSLFG